MVLCPVTKPHQKDRQPAPDRERTLISYIYIAPMFPSVVFTLYLLTVFIPFCVVLLADGHDAQAAGIRGSADPGSNGGAAGHLSGHGEKGTGEAELNKTPNIFSECLWKIASSLNGISQELIFFVSSSLFVASP